MIKYLSNRTGKTLHRTWKFRLMELLSSGAQGEYAGLRVIRAYHEHQGASQRKVERERVGEYETLKIKLIFLRFVSYQSQPMEPILLQQVSECMIIQSSRFVLSIQVMAGMKIEKIQLDKNGAVDMKNVADLAQKHKDTLACGIVTYPSTSGVFEETIRYE